MVSLLFRSADWRQGLLIHEIITTSADPPPTVPEPVTILERTTITINGQEGTLLTGKGDDGTPCNQLRWRAADRYLILTTIYPPEELLKVARSMPH
ncbi:MAG: DUF4367 domain-containing protein [Chloroflexi bacterium]|nr:DUF4367 domain-containing protein [Chloroflexota bacterium]